MSEPFDSRAALTDLKADLKAENALLWEYWDLTQTRTPTEKDQDRLRYLCEYLWSIRGREGK